MRSLDMWGPLRRRWYLLLAGVLVTGGLAATAFALVGPEREIRSSALLLPPDVSVVAFPAPEATGNPFLRLDGLDPALSVLITKMMAEETSDRLLEGAAQTTYEVAEDPLSQAPIIVVTVSGEDPDDAEVVLDRVTEEMPQVLDGLQREAGVRAPARITLVPLVRDAQPTLVWGGLLRLLIVLVGVGFVGTLLLTGLWDALARSRAARRTTAPGAVDAPGETPAEVDPAAGDAAKGDKAEADKAEVDKAEADKARAAAETGEQSGEDLETEGQEPAGEVTAAKARVS